MTRTIQNMGWMALAIMAGIFLISNTRSAHAKYSAHQVVSDTVHEWAEAWSNRNADRYIAFYAPEFMPAAGHSRKEWEQTARQRLAADKSIHIKVDHIHVEFTGKSRAVVHYIEHHRSGGHTYKFDKELVFQKVGMEWFIVAERRLDK